MEYPEVRAESYPVKLTERDITEIQIFCDVAFAHGTRLSPKELILLLGSDISESEFLQAWNRVSQLSSTLEIKSGLIVRKGEGGETQYLESEEQRRKHWAKRNLQYGEMFARLNRNRIAKVVSVSGSSSYGSISTEDDLDFFCITKQNALWLFLTRSLILARVLRFLKRDSPSLCFSYVMEDAYAWRQFKETRNAIFARDALNACVIDGSSFYYTLLSENRWLSEYYPKLYRLKINPEAAPAITPIQRELNIVAKMTNLFLYYLVGKYLRLKADFENRRISKEGRFARLFVAKIARDHCIYESVRYAELRHRYLQIKSLNAST